MRKQLVEAKRIVVKVGSSLLTSGESWLNVDYIHHLSSQIATARMQGREIVIVSSGSVAAGLGRLNWEKRPPARVDLQVAAAVGQMILVNAYENAFIRHKLHAALLLLTAEDMAHRTLYLNARATLRQLLKYSVVPIINENDAIATDTASFGDNDRLAAQVANLLEADVLLILTDVPGLCRHDGDCSDVVTTGYATDLSLEQYIQPQGDGGIGSGGMKTKLMAARIAARSGAHSLIADGRSPDAISIALSGDETFGTFLLADMQRLPARKRWLASGLHLRGKMKIDAGAVVAITSGKRSLLSAGVSAIEGNFSRGDAVCLLNPDGEVIGYGLVNYDSQAAKKLCGVQSHCIQSVLGYVHEEEIIHRDNMTVLK